MREGIIREGDSIEEIISLICEEYSVTEDALEIQILEEAKKGFFGVGKRKAKARINFNISEITDSPGKTDAVATNVSRKAVDVLSKIIELAQIDATVEGSQNKDKIYLNIIGDGSGILIGKRGKTLDSIQYLVNKIVAKEHGENHTVIVDTENYRFKRKENLKVMAQKLSEKAKRIGKPISLRSMNAKERRIIHMALKGEKDIITKSVGRGENKKLVIFPSEEKKQNGRRNRKR